MFQTIISVLLQLNEVAIKATKDITTKDVILK